MGPRFTDRPAVWRASVWQTIISWWTGVDIGIFERCPALNPCGAAALRELLPLADQLIA